MAKQIKGKDIIEDQHLDNAIKSAEQLLKVYKQLDDQIIKTAKDTKKVSKGAGNTSAAGIQKTTQALKSSNALKKEAIAIDSRIEKGQAQLTLAYSRQAKQLANQKLLQSRANKAAKEAAILSSKSSTAYEKESVKLNQLRKKLKDLVLTEGAAAKSTKKMQQEVARLDSRLKKADAAAGQFQRSVGGYKQAIGGAVTGLKNLAGALGVVGGVRLLTNVLRDSFNIMKNFDQATANLSSVLGVNKDEMAELTAQAKELGATTKFTASQVSELQLEFAKLGFTQKEIQGVTEATLELAAAAGTDLATAATVTGATIRGFGLDTSETQRVVDVMAKSFSASSLDMAKFQTAMASVAPVAATMGVSIEETTALIGTLTDAGVDASSAGSGLRNMFLDSNKAGLTFDQALSKINSSTDKVGESFKLFGKRGATLGVILAQNQEKTAGLEKTLQSAGGAAKEMADKQLNTLQGSLDLLRSAWEGFILGADGAGGISEKLQKIIKFLANNLEEILSTIKKVAVGLIAYKVALKAVNIAQSKFSTNLKPGRLKAWALVISVAVIAITALIDKLVKGSLATQALAKATESINQKMDIEVVKMEGLRTQLLKTNKGSQERKDIIDEINRTYGTTLTNLNDEKQLLIDIEKAYRNIAAGMLKKITLEVLKQDIIDTSLALKRAIRIFGEDAPQVQQLADALNVLKGEFTAAENAIGNTGQTAGVAGNDIEKMGKGLQNMGNDAEEAGKKVKGLKKELTDFSAIEEQLQFDLFKQTEGDKANQDIENVKILADAEKQRLKEVGEANQKQEDDAEKARLAEIKRLKDREKELQKFRRDSIKIFEDITNARIAGIEKQIEKKNEDVQDSKTAIQNLQQLAAQGNTDAAESIKAERIKLAKEKLEIEKLEKKKRNLLAQIVLLRSANSLFEQGDSNAFANATSKFNEFASNLKLPGFYDGTEETVAKALGATNTRDGHHVMLHDNEHVIGAKDSDSLHKAGFSKTSDIVSAAMQNNNLTRQAMLMSGGSGYLEAHAIQVLGDRFEKAIDSLEITQQHIDILGLKETIKKGNKITNNDYNAGWKV